MKTKNNAQKTENRNYRKSVAKTFAVILSLVLISFTVSANGFWKQILVNSAYGKMTTLLLSQGSNHISISEFPAAVPTMEESFGTTDLLNLNAETDRNLGLETWMTNDASFNANSLTDRVESEKPLTVESWMTENQNFESTENTTENEPALGVESWMTDNAVWSLN